MNQYQTTHDIRCEHHVGGPCTCILSQQAAKRTVPGVPPHVERMGQELAELLPRLRNLDGFTDTKTFKELPTLEQKLMHDQRDSMEEYAKTLALRYHLSLI